MFQSAAEFLAEAPLGALVRWSDGTPRPPARHVRKISDWEHRNGTGRLVGRDVEPASIMLRSFTIHVGDFGEAGTIVMRMHRVFGANTPLRFEIVSVPQPGEALVITSLMGRDELQHVAPDRDTALRWQAAHGYRDARIDVVPPTAIAA
ncbi:hypothetical protein [Sphingomonas sp. 1185]|uniref:hypothetical protein n=1 Tax=Sphingomonas sp. 1185 TaxID=3156411 RepID=UPI003394EF11